MRGRSGRSESLSETNAAPGAKARIASMTAGVAAGGSSVVTRRVSAASRATAKA